MTETIPLDAMLRRASRMAAQMFDEYGEVTMFWLTETAAGEQYTLVTPMVVPPHMSAVEAKLSLSKKLRELFKERDVVRYAGAMEAWTVEPDDHQGPIAENPKRREIVAFRADDGIEYIGAQRDIIRPPHGKAYLGKLSTIDKSQPTGRLKNLLNNVRPSSELADDEGTVFMTHVPGSPIQIIGRRGPTGELFVDAVGRHGREEQELVAGAAARAAARGVEVVTGPEAERLIAGVQRKLAASRNNPTKH
jgi:hypothetical protein